MSKPQKTTGGWPRIRESRAREEAEKHTRTGFLPVPSGCSYFAAHPHLVFLPWCSFRRHSILWEQVKIPKDAAPAPVVEMLPDGNTPAKVTRFTQRLRLSQSRHATYQMLCPYFASRPHLLSPCNLDGLILADSNWEHLGDQFRWWRCADQPAIFWHPRFGVRAGSFWIAILQRP